MRRVLSLALAIVLLAGLFTCVPPAKAASKEDCNRVIGVVFDNSGSMYVGTTDSKKAWCRATYATEAFAAMMNPGDIMQVYPMNPITVDGVTYTYDDPLVMDQSNSAIIRDIYTPKPGDTHIETIKAACEGVLRTDADEKWLVVLTDGDVFYRNGVSLGKGEGTVSALEADLSECNSKMHVMYLGMGSQCGLLL